MARYIFACRSCGAWTEGIEPDPMAVDHIACGACGAQRGWKRDYRAEGVVANTAGLARERDGKDNTWFRDNFLPTAKDYAGPSDPDGSKGLQKWNDEHGPRDDNHKPVRPEVPKRVF